MRVSRLVLMFCALAFFVSMAGVPARADDYYISMYSCGCAGPMVLTHNHTGCADGGGEQDLADMAEACLNECGIRLAGWRTVECEDDQSGEWSSVSLKCPNNCPA